MKRILALLLALAMVFSLAACGEKENDDAKKNGGSESAGTPYTGEVTGLTVGFGIKDIDALVKAIANQDPGMDIENVYVEFGGNDSAGMLALGAKLLGKQYDAKLLAGKEGLVLNAPGLLDANYGISPEGIEEFVDGFMSGFMSGLLARLPEGFDIDLALSLVEKYGDKLVEEFKTNSGLTVTTENGKTTYSGELTNEAIATVAVNVIEELFADDDFFTLLGAVRGMTPEEAKNALTSGMPATDELINTLTTVMDGYGLSIKINELTIDENGLPVVIDVEVGFTMEGHSMEIASRMGLTNMDIAMTAKMDGVVIYQYIVNANSLYYATSVGQNSTVMSITFNDSGFTGYMEMDGVKMMEMTGTIAKDGFTLSMTLNGSTMVLSIKTTGNTVEGKATLDGQEIGKIIFKKKYSGSKTTFTLQTLVFGGTTMDLSAAGISFWYDVNPSISVPADFTDITKMSPADMQAVLEKITTENADLFELIGSILPEIKAEPDYDDIYGDSYYDDIYDDYMGY